MARHPAPFAIVAAALAAIATVFVFFRPEYHRPNQGSLLKIDMSRFRPRATAGPGRTASRGFRFGEHEEEWNDFFQVQAAELAPARAAARRWGVDPESVRFIDAIRIGPQDLNMIVAGTNAADRTCLGFVTPGAPVEYYCPERLETESALVLLIRGNPYEADGQTITPAWLMGIQRADVTRVTVDQPPDWNQLNLEHSYWGAWDLSLGYSPDVVVTAYLRDGRVRRAAVDLTRPGDRVIPVPGYREQLPARRSPRRAPPRPLT